MIFMPRSILPRWLLASSSTKSSWKMLLSIPLTCDPPDRGVPAATLTKPRATSFLRQIRAGLESHHRPRKAYLARYRRLFPVEALALDDKRQLADLRVHRADVLADDADEEELHRREEEHADDHGGQAHLESAPEHELQHQVDDGQQQAQAREHEADQGSDADRHARVLGDAEQRHVE